jgi:hypothetical protein
MAFYLAPWLPVRAHSPSHLRGAGDELYHGGNGRLIPEVLRVRHAALPVGAPLRVERSGDSAVSHLSANLGSGDVLTGLETLAGAAGDDMVSVADTAAGGVLVYCRSSSGALVCPPTDTPVVVTMHGRVLPLVQAAGVPLAGDVAVSFDPATGFFEATFGDGVDRTFESSDLHSIGYRQI